MTMTYQDIPKEPRWISTEAGKWAWQAHHDWRLIASSALSVQDRMRLLAEAEKLQRGEAEVEA